MRSERLSIGKLQWTCLFMLSRAHLGIPKCHVMSRNCHGDVYAVHRFKKEYPRDRGVCLGFTRSNRSAHIKHLRVDESSG